MAEHAAEATERTMEEMGSRIPLYQRISTADEVADVVVFGIRCVTLYDRF